MNIVEEYLDQEGVQHRPSPDWTFDDVVNTVAARLITIELPDLPPEFRVPAQVVRAVLAEAVDVIGWLVDGGEPVKAPAAESD